jgi:hypothetical protein
MSPLQYQKQPRLHDARDGMLIEGLVAVEEVSGAIRPRRPRKRRDRVPHKANVLCACRARSEPCAVVAGAD